MQLELQIKMDLAQKIIGVIQKPYYNKADISTLIDKKTYGPIVFNEILNYIKHTYPEYYNRQPMGINRVPKIYALEYLKKYHGFDADDYLKWYKKMREIS